MTKKEENFQWLARNSGEYSMLSTERPTFDDVRWIDAGRAVGVDVELIPIWLKPGQLWRRFCRVGFSREFHNGNTYGKWNGFWWQMEEDHESKRIIYEGTKRCPCEMIKPEKCCFQGDYKCQVPMPIAGRRQEIDVCIADIVSALNANDIEGQEWIPISELKSEHVSASGMYLATMQNPPKRSFWPAVVRWGRDSFVSSDPSIEGVIIAVKPLIIDLYHPPSDTNYCETCKHKLPVEMNIEGAPCDVGVCKLLFKGPCECGMPGCKWAVK